VLASYTDTTISLQHKNSDKYLGIYYREFCNNSNDKLQSNDYKSPLTNHTEGNH